MEIIVSLIIIYFVIGTIILLNILFNPNLTVGKINEQGEEEPLNNFQTIVFCLWWIVFIPMIILEGRFNINE